jgi:hypothetical protein
MKKHILTATIVGAIGLAVVACSDTTTADMGNDMAVTQPDMSAPSCYPSLWPAAQPHVEIINQCTDSQAVDIMPYWPSMAPGGVLPTIPGNT